MHSISIYSLQQATQFWAILGYSPTVLLITVCVMITPKDKLTV